MTDRTANRRVSDEEIHEMFHDFKEHKQHEVHDREQLLKCMNENRKAVEALTESTKGILEAWEATQGAVKVSAVIGKFVKWGVGVGAPLYGVYHLLKGTGKIG